MSDTRWTRWLVPLLARSAFERGTSRAGTSGASSAGRARGVPVKERRPAKLPYGFSARPTRLRPARLAAYRAWSAAPTSRSSDSASLGKLATPMLTVMPIQMFVHGEILANFEAGTQLRKALRGLQKTERASYFHIRDSWLGDDNRGGRWCRDSGGCSRSRIIFSIATKSESLDLSATLPAIMPMHNPTRRPRMNILR